MFVLFPFPQAIVSLYLCCEGRRIICLFVSDSRPLIRSECREVLFLSVFPHLFFFILLLGWVVYIHSFSEALGKVMHWKRICKWMNITFLSTDSTYLNFHSSLKQFISKFIWVILISFWADVPFSYALPVSLFMTHFPIQIPAFPNVSVQWFGVFFRKHIVFKIICVFLLFYWEI